MEQKSKRNWLGCMVAGAMACVLLCGTAIAASNIRTAQIQANYMDIKLVVDGIEVVPKDANGNIVEPFASEGTTYLPVRALANALGKDVAWDGETKTVYIGAKPGEAESWMRKLPPYQVGSQCQAYDGSDLESYFTVAGVKHSEGVYLSSFAAGYGRVEAYALWNTNLQYNSMSFKVGHIDGKSDNSTKLEVYLDGEFSTEYDLAWDGPIQTITVPLNYAGNVKLKLADGYCYFGLYDISFAE